MVSQQPENRNTSNKIFIFIPEMYQQNAMKYKCSTKKQFHIFTPLITVVTDGLVDKVSDC